MAGTARRGCALPRERCADGPGPGSGGVRPGGGQRQLRAARRAAGGRAARVGAMIRRLRPWLTLAETADHRAHSRSEEHTSELQSRLHLVCRLLLEKKKNKK